MENKITKITQKENNMVRVYMMGSNPWPWGHGGIEPLTHDSKGPL